MYNRGTQPQQTFNKHTHKRITWGTEGGHGVCGTTARGVGNWLVDEGVETDKFLSNSGEPEGRGLRGGGGGVNWDIYETKSPKSTLLADNTQGYKIKPRPVPSAAPHPNM